ESNLLIESVNPFKMTVTGLNMTIKNEMAGKTRRDILSGKVAATDLGITSEIIMIVTVVTAVATPTLTPKSTARIVINVGKTIFDMLLPIRIVVINSLGFANNFDNFSDFLSPFCASV